VLVYYEVQAPQMPYSGIKMKGPLFKDKKGNQFYYSPSTSRIVQVPNDISKEYLVSEDFSFKFGYDNEKIRAKLDSELDTLILEATQDCNLRCTYCIYGGNYKGERNHKPITMSKDIAQKSIDYFLEHSKNKRPLRAVSFYEGEPLMNFKIIENAVERCKKEDRTIISISTNGLLLQKYADYIREENINVAISLDGPKEIHDKNRKSSNSKPTFDIIMKGVEGYK